MSMLPLVLAGVLGFHGGKVTPIDRKAVVSRHNVVLTKLDSEAPIQVGNGEFAIGLDITGLQSFVPFNTMSQWGWHTGPLSPGTKISDYQGQVWETHGRSIRYPMYDPDHPVISEWLAANPHRINLGRLGLSLIKRDGSLAEAADLKNTRQTLDLWTGIVTSRFELEGVPVTVKTACHPKQDSVAVHVESPLVSQGRISAFLECPGNNPLQFANFVGDWAHPGKFEEVSATQNRADFVRKIDNDVYSVALSWQSGAELRRPVQTELKDFKILRAVYGAGSQWLDVTDQVAEAVRKGIPIRADNQLGPDPAPKKIKSMRVTYSSANGQRVVMVGENEDFTVSPQLDQSRLRIVPGASTTFAFVCTYSPKRIGTVATSAAIFEASRKEWPAYWNRGGFVDLSESQDPRWRELERRVILSQYLMKVNEAGSLPPQESGLVNNGWFGRFHLEMVWWHAAHWAIWNRWPEVDKSFELYNRILPQAKALAKSQGYFGARWPKCIGPNGREWPHEIHSLLGWQQPHPIFFAELDYRAHPTMATLKKWEPVVEATADFLASYAFFDTKTSRYILGPPMVLVSENTNSKTTQNPTYELSYWRFGLRTAQLWRKRMGSTSKPEWDKVQTGLAPLPVQDGLYVTHEDIVDMWTKWTFEHPALIGAFGMLPGDGVDRSVMKATLDKVVSSWDLNRTWGWDFPMMAMCAARVGEPERAIDLLLHSSPGFQFDERGFATGGPFPYFPSNGGLLYAVGMMAAGWDGAPKVKAPGFPKSWKVKYEGMAIAP